MKKKNKDFKILIVEDDNESVELLQYFLKPENYSIEVAGDGKQALATFEIYSPDLIILDVMLPEMDGFAVCEAIKKNSDNGYIPIIMLTALKELKDKIKAIESGADDFITKPFDSLELLARVRSLLKAKVYFDELQKANRKLEKQNRMLVREDKLKQDLIHLIVHDMKNPLLVIQGNLQMMDMFEQFKSPIARKYIMRIEKSSRNLLRMILNLLDISRLENNLVEINRGKVEISRLINQKIQYFKTIGDLDRIEFKFDVTEENFYGDLDGELFERVMDNLLVFLINNAPKGEEVSLSLEKSNGQIIISCYQRGNPIPAKYYKKIFLRSAQTELKKAGFRIAKGLGLIFCKLALNVMDADISIIGDGTTGNRIRIVCREVH